MYHALKQRRGWPVFAGHDAARHSYWLHDCAGQQT